MDCVTGVPFTYDPSGVLLTCAEPIEVNGIGDAVHEFLYLVDRLPVYVVAGGALAGLVLLVLTAMAVRVLMS